MQTTTELQELDREVREWMAEPHRFFKAFSRTARRFQHQHPSGRLRTMTLVGGPDEFLSSRPVRFHVWERTYPATSWEQVLVGAVTAIATTNPELLLDLDRAGMLPWIVRQEAGMNLLEAFRLGKATLRLDSLAEVFRQTQWLLLMAGVKLNEAIVQVNPFTDEQWKVREAELQTKRAEEKRVLREIDQARQRYAEAHPDEGADASAASGGPSGPERGGFVF